MSGDLNRSNYEKNDAGCDIVDFCVYESFDMDPSGIISRKVDKKAKIRRRSKSEQVVITTFATGYDGTLL